MLSYQHAYHAGNRADLHKHGLLTWLLTRLIQKDKPASYIDVFAGRGRYDLAGAASRKTGEADAGITRVAGLHWPTPVQPWRRLITAHNPAGGMRYYAGSPLLAAELLRPQDKLCLCELHPQEFAALQTLFKHDDRVGLHHRHAHEALAALLPPTPRRGLVLLDPSYEVKDEYLKMAALTMEAYKKWPTGCFVLWYPLLDGHLHADMTRRLESGGYSWLKAEWQWRETWHEGRGMLGSGLFVINPPWQTDTFINTWQHTLCGWFDNSSTRLEQSNT